MPVWFHYKVNAILVNCALITILALLADTKKMISVENKIKKNSSPLIRL